MHVYYNTESSNLNSTEKHLIELYQNVANGWFELIAIECLFLSIFICRVQIWNERKYVSFMRKIEQKVDNLNMHNLARQK